MTGKPDETDLLVKEIRERLDRLVAAAEPAPDEIGQDPPKPGKVGWDRCIELFFTFAIFVATIGNVWVASRQWDVMGGQLKVMQADLRPWISASYINIVGMLTHDDSGLHMTMQFVLKNSGHSPARSAFVSFKPSLSAWGPEDTKKVCADAENSMLKLSIFPGDTVTQGFGGTIPEEAFKIESGASAYAGLPIMGEFKQTTLKFHRIWSDIASIPDPDLFKNYRLRARA